MLPTSRQLRSSYLLAYSLHFSSSHNRIRPWEALIYQFCPGRGNIDPLTISIEERALSSALLRRQQHSDFSVEVEMEYQPHTENDFAGLTLFQNEKHQFLYGMTQIDKSVQLVLYRIGGDKKVKLNTVSFDVNNPVKLKIEGSGGKADFFYSIRGESWKPLASDTDISNLSTKKAKGFTGTLIGLYATKSADSRNTIKY